jgi:hypothetical protein
MSKSDLSWITCHSSAATAAVVAMCNVVLPAQAGEIAVASAMSSKPIGQWKPVSQARLGAARGGFSTAGGLELSLGIERTVSINGVLSVRSSFYIADLRSIGKTQAEALTKALSETNLSQSGRLNSAAAQGLLPGTFVQNSLNDQAIETRTVISTAVNSAGMMKEINFMSSVRDASINALGGN